MQPDEAPVIERYVPAAQPEQLDEPVLAWYDPDGQLEHVLEPVEEYFPTGQAMQVDEDAAAIAAEYRPAAHRMQLDTVT